jgi:hypothetical protein
MFHSLARLNACILYINLGFFIARQFKIKNFLPLSKSQCESLCKSFVRKFGVGKVYFLIRIDPLMFMIIMFVIKVDLIKEDSKV